MKKREEIRKAHLLWERLLRNHYNDEFLALVRNDPSLLPPGPLLMTLYPSKVKGI